MSFQSDEFLRTLQKTYRRHTRFGFTDRVLLFTVLTTLLFMDIVALSNTLSDSEARELNQPIITALGLNATVFDILQWMLAYLLFAPFILTGLSIAYSIVGARIRGGSR